MTRLIISAGLLSLLASCGCNLSTAAEFSNHLVEQGHFCSSCNYQGAQDIAKQHAVPTLHCKYTRTPTEDYVEQCNSLPKPYFVMNEQTGELWGFQVSHAPQGASRQTLQLKTSARNVDPAVASQAEILRRGKLQWAAAVTAATADLNQTIPTNKLAAHPLSSANLHELLWGKTYAASNNCNVNPHARALSNGLSANYRLNMQQRVNTALKQQMAQGRFTDLQSAFERFEISGVQATGGFTYSPLQPNVSISLSVSFANRLDALYIREVYKSGSAESRIYWQVSLENNKREILVNLDMQGSRIDEIPAIEILQNQRRDLKLDPCVSSVLKDNFNEANTPQRGSDADQSRWLDNNKPTFGQLPGRNDDGGRDRGWVCLYTLRNPFNGETVSYLSRCP